MAKVIRLDPDRAEAAAAEALDRRRVIYETEWQAVRPVADALAGGGQTMLSSVLHGAWGLVSEH